MSVELIIVALLAATAFTTGAAGGKRATTVVCRGDDNENECDCVEKSGQDITRTVTKYVVGQCTKISHGEYGIVEDCTPGGAVVVRSAKNPTCAKQEMFFYTECKSLQYEGLKCEDDTISFVAACSTDKCSTCSTLFTIPRNDVTTCYNFNNHVFKLAKAVTDCSTGSIEINEHSAKDCSDSPSLVSKQIQCTPVTSGLVYGKGTCKKDENKVSLSFCVDAACSNCPATEEVPFGESTAFNAAGITVSVEGCESNKPIRALGHYTAGTHTSNCHKNGNVYSKGTCEYMTATATIPTTTTTTTDTSDSGNNDGSSGGNNSDGGSGSSGEENNNMTTNKTDGVSLAAAHSVAVLALVVCLLATVY